MDEQERARRQPSDLLLRPELDQRVGSLERKLAAHFGEFGVDVLETRLGLRIGRHDLERVDAGGLARAYPPGAVGSQARLEFIPFPVAAQGAQPTLPVARTGDADDGG